MSEKIGSFVFDAGCGFCQHNALIVRRDTRPSAAQCETAKVNPGSKCDQVHPKRCAACKDATRPSAALTDEERMAWECQSGTGCVLWRENRDCGHGSILAACVRRLSTRPAEQGLREAEAAVVTYAQTVPLDMVAAELRKHGCLAMAIDIEVLNERVAKYEKALAALHPEEQKNHG